MDELHRDHLKAKMISLLTEARIKLTDRELQIVESCAIIAENEGNKYKRRKVLEDIQSELRSIKRSLR